MRPAVYQSIATKRYMGMRSVAAKPPTKLAS